LPSSEGTLAEASLRFRESDLHAVRGTLRFRDNEVVEIVEVPGASPVTPDVPRLAVEPSAPGPAQTETPEAVTPGEELRVWAALRRIDADLGEPIEVERSAAESAIFVTAVGLNPERRRVLEEALRGLPKVQLRFRDSQPVREPARQLPPAGVASSAPLLPQLESQLGRGLAEEFVNQTLEASEACLVRAHALRELAQHYPVELEANLSPPDRALLQSLLSNHYAGLNAATRRILERVRQVAPPAQAAPAPVSAPSWQAAAHSMVPAIEQVDRVLTKLLAGGSTTSSYQVLIAELDDAARRMETELAGASIVFERNR
jgi:hypothetical protein